MTTSEPRIPFPVFWNHLDVVERIEKLVRDVIQGQSEIKTLTKAYKLVIQSHNTKIAEIVEEVSDRELKEQTEHKLKEFAQLASQINESRDIVDIDAKFEKLCEIFRNLKGDDVEEQKIFEKLCLIRKNNERFLRLTQERLDEYCQRIMIMSEAQRDRKKNFASNLEKEKQKMQDEMMEDIIKEFQKMRVAKLRTFVGTIDDKHFKHYNARLEDYKDVIETQKVLGQHVFQLENQLRETKFEKRKLPYLHDREVEELTKTVSANTITVQELEKKIRDAQMSRVTSVAVARREKKKFGFELSKLLSETARKQAQLCKLTQKALRRRLPVSEEIRNKVCADFDNCNCSLNDYE